MDAEHRVNDIAEALVAQRHPSVAGLNRLECRPRARAFDRSLRAEVRDALWMLSRQWQFGEFRADDAGSPVLTTLRLEHAPLSSYSAGSVVEADWDAAVPLEARV